MNHEEKDDLWELLGKAPQRSASPFFANKVMHAIKREEPKPATFWMWLRQRWIVPVTAGACAVALGLMSLNEPPQVVKPAAPVTADPLAEMVAVISENNDEFESSLSDLLATEDHSVWLAADPSSIY